MDEAGEEQKSAFVTYQKAEDAKEAVQLLHENYRFREMSAKPIQCRMAASSEIASYSSAAAHGQDPVQTQEDKQGNFIHNAVQDWLEGSAGLETDSD